MCGLVGFLEISMLHDHKTMSAVLTRMADRIESRGPDDFGFWADNAGIGLAHRRLSILDLSPAGHQPMISHAGRYVLVFNGEIYNHLDLRSELSKYNDSEVTSTNWHGNSDTETLLECFAAWGVKETVERCVGMFAFALWDRQKAVLTLGRDRLGEKPLYYGWQRGGEATSFLFGSELKALKAHPSFSACINRDSLCLLMRHGYIPAPHSIYQDIFKLPAGSLLTISSVDKEPVIEPYWSLTKVAVEGNNSTLDNSPQEITSQLDDLLKSAVRQQMISDVPLGAFLSGGIDSSLIVALMQDQSERAVKTFTIGFNEKDYNEAVHSKGVASYLGTDHTEMYITPRQALDVIPKLPRLYCEPFADSSQIPTFLVSQLAREKVTVVLSGDGGDELFGGYNRYILAHNLWSKVSRLPKKIRSPAASCIRSISPTSWNALLSPFDFLLRGSLKQVNLGDKLHKGAGVLAAESIDELYLGLISQWNPSELVIGGQEPITFLQGNSLDLQSLSDVQRMMALDAITYLPDDVLVKVDRAAMGVSLESRVPLLDHRVVEFAWRVPQSLKLRDGVGKWILRQLLYKYVPKDLVERPKMGFGVPLGDWLRGPLRDWAEALLDESRLQQEGFFYPAAIRKKWLEHISGRQNWQYQLWNVLMFQAWLEEQRN